MIIQRKANEGWHMKGTSFRDLLQGIAPATLRWSLRQVWTSRTQTVNTRGGQVKFHEASLFNSNQFEFVAQVTGTKLQLDFLTHMGSFYEATTHFLANLIYFTLEVILINSSDSIQHENVGYEKSLEQEIT